MPFDIAFGLDETTRTAWSIMFSEMEGAKFNYRSFQWVEDR